MSLAAATVLITFFVGLAIAIYRLQLHPLAAVPGPRLAALSTWYEAYYDLIQKGQLPWQLKKLHERYGPIVRIGPCEVHITDDEFILETFTTARPKLDKHTPHRHQLGVPDATVSTVPHTLHQLRRSAVAPFLAASRVANSHSLVILASIKKVTTYLEKVRHTGAVVDLRKLLWYMATDTVTEIAFPEGTHLLDASVLQSDYYNFQKGGQSMFLWFKHFPILWGILKSIPPACYVKMEPQAAIPVAWEVSNKRIAEDILKGKDTSDKGTIIHHIRLSNLPKREKELRRVWKESASLVGAGGETVTNTICTTIFYILRDPSIESRLVEELNAAIPDAAKVATLHVLLALPYLAAVVQEGLRKAIGIISRFIRVNPSETTIYQSYKLPPGTAISYSSFFTNNNTGVFPEPQKFMPERWLDAENNELASRRRRLLLTFGTGARRCLGEHLATAEVTYVAVILFRRFKLELYDTSERDVEPVYDSLMPLPAEGSKGIRVKVR